MAGDTGGGVRSVGWVSLLPFKEAHLHSSGPWEPLLSSLSSSPPL